MARKKKTLSIEEILDNERNVAAVLVKDVLDRIGSVCVYDFKKDKDSRADWEERSKDIMKLALQVVEDKNYPWPNAANVKYPPLTLSAVQFASRVDLFQGPDVVKVETTGWDGDGLKYDRALRIQKHMSWQLSKQMRGWDDDNGRMMHALPIIGAMFKKTYYCPVKEHNVSELVYPDLLVFDYWAKDVETAILKTQILSLNQNDIHERVTSGVYSDVDLGLEAIREVHRGGSPMTTHLARKVTQSFQRVGLSPQPTENLSEREQEVLDCLSQGFLYKEIADKLGSSYETVHTYIRRIYEKLQVRTRTEAVAKFLRR